MLITQKITLDLMRSGVPPVVNVMQADTNTRTVEASLYVGGVPFSLAADEDVTISVAYKKPDGTGGWYDVLPDGSPAATITGNVVTAKLAPQVLSVPGSVAAALRIENVGETHRVSTFPFVIQVDADPGIGAIESENYYNVQNWDDVNESIKDIFTSIEVFTNCLFAEGVTIEYTPGAYSNNNGVALYNATSEVTAAWKCVVLDVTKNTGATLGIVTYTDKTKPIMFVDDSLNIVSSYPTTTGNPNNKFEVSATVPEGATKLIINHYFINNKNGEVAVTGYKVEKYINKEEAEEIFRGKITQEQGDSETLVMSQKAVTAFLGRTITPVVPVKNRVPVVDEDVAIYLDNMFDGISPKEAVLVSTNNAYVPIFNKEVALLTSDKTTGQTSANIRLHFLDDTKYEVSRGIPHDKATAKTGTKKVLFIGDSITENQSYLTPLKQLSDNGDYKIVFLGTLGAEDLKNEGRGGWAAYNYCNEGGTYINKTNAFWDGSAFNFSYYMQNSGIDVPDYIFINLGTNDLIRGISDTSDLEEIKSVITTSYETMINSIRAYSTTIPIVLWLPPTRSLIGRNNHKEIDRCLRAHKILIDKFDTNAYMTDRVYLMATYLFVNPYTDYPSFTTTIGGIEYKDGTEAIHPNTNGGEKMAKGIIRQMMYIDGLI